MFGSDIPQAVQEGKTQISCLQKKIIQTLIREKP
jgi:hypothetical protein